MNRNLKRLCLCLLLAALLLWMGIPASAEGETYYGKSDWQVTFTDRMETNFKSQDITDVFGQVLPGDSAEVTIKLVNRNVNSTDWYMRNNVLKSLEDDNSVAGGGGYSYKLTYKDKNGKETVLYDSDQVGGENNSPAGGGLHEATNALKDYFYLDTLKTNESGSVTLHLNFEGEGHDNLDQNTLAKLQMDFAVELDAPTTSRRTTTTSTTVRTGDETNLLPLYIAMGVSGLVLLVLGIVIYKKDNKTRGDE